jgi:hypothetical protein
MGRGIAHRECFPWTNNIEFFRLALRRFGG